MLFPLKSLSSPWEVGKLHFLQSLLALVIFVSKHTRELLQSYLNTSPKRAESRDTVAPLPKLVEVERINSVHLVQIYHAPRNCNGSRK